MPDEGTHDNSGDSQGGSTTTTTVENGGGGQSDKTFTQAQLEKIVQDRLSRATSKFADYDDLKSKAAKVDELEQSQMSEMDKLRTRAEREAEKRAASDDKAKTAVARMETALKRSAVVSAAAAAGAADPDDVFTLLDKSTLELDDAGEVTGAADAVKDLLERKPHLLARAGGFGAGRQGVPSSAKPDMNALLRGAAGFGGR